ncbi:MULTISPECIES: NAD(P)/FAD-dependent oxidoreductase [unclassified Mesorhizobium]|uniref:NAD(P)-binding domain-containing protein n=1 Tax=unclassified Mesorhizobium TaxID=325217 RepID=UPI00112B78B2|nr:MULTISPECIES: NAD(P)/FAD-dependent oxidoreductase [unclassified Mesorhizobium]TPK68391.1 NAD(P)/FAD-dependent oxidoreductase [Mesorhizobium sp. B2-5-1]TPM62636.1 NAD(P)/FAD-dependent oxidoreductase [Mesorhizobium sp. B2-1-9]TPM87684.1 NAD(P)/FAD-dependent oxidoreductase [Mesorhizobium sp. B2-1-4]TPN12474.1 NAD(P)/FAD-dependent oxidoreductase [Mesorhizobium sp. B2-1-2]UCI15680.1 NAD(P)/FAD-dependent oxidoreductase [Mesorhizobium sp. B2-1-1]
MTASVRSNDCEVAVVGAGPFGLGVATALRAADVDVLAFGSPMGFWRENMPRGMRLRSPWRATFIGNPNGPLSLDSYASGQRVQLREPLLRQDFVDYGMWVQAQAVPDLDTRMVSRVERTNAGFRLILADGDVVRAGRVIVAMGLKNQELVPAAFTGLPSELVSHTSAHTGFEAFAGKHVAVVGRGQSACESAVLLRKAGADVELVCRGDIHWLGAPSSSRGRNVLGAAEELLASPSRVGPFPLSWLIEAPGLVHGLPAAARRWVNARGLRAGASGWLLPDFGGIEVKAGRVIVGASASNSGIDLRFENGSTAYDHVLLATGYRIDIGKLGLFAPDFLDAIACRDGSPVLSTGLESNIPGLHFVGASAVASFGPLMRFTAATPYAAQAVTRFIRTARSKGQNARRSTMRLGEASVPAGPKPR